MEPQWRAWDGNWARSYSSSDEDDDDDSSAELLWSNHDSDDVSDHLQVPPPPLEIWRRPPPPPPRPKFSLLFVWCAMAFLVAGNMTWSSASLQPPPPARSPAPPPARTDLNYARGSSSLRWTYRPFGRPPLPRGRWSLTSRLALITVMVAAAWWWWLTRRKRCGREPRTHIV